MIIDPVVLEEIGFGLIIPICAFKLSKRADVIRASRNGAQFCLSISQDTSGEAH